MFKKAMRILVIIYLAALFISTQVVQAAAEDVKVDPAIVKFMRDRITRAKQLEKHGSRPENELENEIIASIMISSALNVAANVLREQGSMALDKLDLAKVAIEPAITFATVPIAEKSFAYLALRDIYIVKGNKENAKRCVEKAYQNIITGVKYYANDKISGSPFALFNNVFSRVLLTNVFKVDLGKNSKSEIQHGFEMLSQEDSLIKDRVNELTITIKAWDKAIEKYESKKGGGK